VREGPIKATSKPTAHLLVTTHNKGGRARSSKTKMPIQTRTGILNLYGCAGAPGGGGGAAPFIASQPVVNMPNTAASSTKPKIFFFIAVNVCLIVE
jgi:hypothetical protein